MTRVATELTLRGRPGDVRTARSFLRRVLNEHGINGEGTDAELVLSELVTNAVVHSSGPIEVVVAVGPDAVALEVRDRGITLPQQRSGEPMDPEDDERGLRIVQALAGGWSVQLTESGKTILARVPLR